MPTKIELKIDLMDLLDEDQLEELALVFLRSAHPPNQQRVIHNAMSEYEMQCLADYLAEEGFVPDGYVQKPE